jgi:hypothetical protein
MRTDAQIVPLGEELALPWDLREWFNAETLRQWITNEIETLDWSNPELVEHLRLRPNYQPKKLLALLTFAYATAVFEFEEMIRHSYSDPTIRAICGDWSPESPHALHRFRRANRGLLKWSLTQLFKRAIRERLGEFRLPAGLKRGLVQAAATRLNIARQMERGAEGLE